jgi:hypothetical protein
MEYLALESIVPKILRRFPKLWFQENDASRVGFGVFKLKLNSAGTGARILLHFQCETRSKKIEK